MIAILLLIIKFAGNSKHHKANEYSKISSPALARCSVGWSILEGLIPGQNTYPDCGFNPQSGHVQEATNLSPLFLFLSHTHNLSLPLSVKRIISSPWVISHLRPVWSNEVFQPSICCAIKSKRTISSFTQFELNINICVPNENQVNP